MANVVWYELELPSGTRLDSREFLAGDVIDLAKRHKVTWAHVVEHPWLSDGQLMLDIFRHYCEKQGEKVPLVQSMASLADRFIVHMPGEVDESEQGDGEDRGEDDADPQTVDAPAST